MKGVFEHFDLKVGDKKQLGEATISAFEFSRKKDPIFAMRAAMDGVAIYDGKYIRLNVAGTLMMSDTDMEKDSNRDFVREANGSVLIAGLGIGLILKNILHKLNDGTITSISIVEKSKDVIALIQPYFKDERIRMIHGDILEWRPSKGVKYDTIYFDIWPTICADNLKEITFLHNVFKHRLNRSNPNCWMNSWMKERLQRMNRKTSSYYW